MLALLANYRDILYGAAFLVLISGFLYYTHHERVIGADKVVAADQAAAAKQLKIDQAVEAQMQKAVATAQESRDAVQTQLDAYQSSHPVGAVLVCSSAPTHRAAVPAASAGARRVVGPVAAPAGVSGVPAVSAPRDIGPTLQLLVQAAGELAADYGQLQKEPR